MPDTPDNAAVHHDAVTRASYWTDRRVCIVGGSSGIGLATAAAVLARGAHVSVASRSTSHLRSAHAVLVQNSDAAARLDLAVMDVTDEAAVEQFFGARPAFDALTVTAGSGTAGGVRDADMAAVLRAADVKLWGAYRVVKHARLTARAAVVLCAGVLSRRPMPGLSAAAAINGAIEALGRALAVELAPVRVTVVSPGIVDTPAYAGMPADARAAMFAHEAERLPARRVGTPENVAEAILHLMSNDFATGTVLDVDGGHLLA